MNSRLVAIIVGIVIIAGAGAAFVLTRDESSEPSQSSETQQTENQPAFNAVSTEGQSFVAKMVTTTDSGTLNATVEYDGKGNAHYTSTSGGNNISMYLTKDGFISCQGSTCFKIPQNQETENINSDLYEYNEDDIEKFRNTAKYLGKESCPAGTCDVWSVEDQNENYTTKVYLANDGRPSKLTSEGPEGDVDVTYEYKPVTVNVPTNVQTLPS